MNAKASQAAEKEERRLAALASYDILDTPREKDYDDIALLASEICGTPIAVVNLIADHRQFFKAEVGLGVRETPFESSFCAKAILEDEFLIVPDATKDHRFDGNPLVTGNPHLRFYAGALLKSDDGLPIGTVCVLDYQPRVLTEAQQRTLRILARQVMTQLELRRTLRRQAREIAIERRLGARRKARVTRLEAETEQARQDEERLRTAEGAGRIGIFEIDVATGEMTVSDEFCRIFGVPMQRTYPATLIESLVLEEDRALPSNDDTRRSGRAKLDVEYRIRRGDDQSLRWIARRARFINDPSGAGVRLIGVAIDVTEGKAGDVRRAALLSLGDRLHDVDRVPDAARIAAEMLAEGLGVRRAGYSTIDPTEDAFIVEYDWTASDAVSIAGRHSLGAFAATIKRLGNGQTLALPDIEAASWLARDAAGYGSIGVRSFIKVPVLERGRLVGVLFAHDDRPRVWTSDELDFARGIADRTYAALAKLRAEAEQAILNQELSHRLKNTLAMVQAIAFQTLKGVTERDAVDAFTSRLQSLSAAHDVLLQQSWSSARMGDVIEKVMSLHAADGRIVVAGPDVALGPKAGLSLSLILHELATNATKYGALSNETGAITVTWSIEETPGDRTLVLSWLEKNGPPVQQPLRKGFGSRLIQMGLAGTGGVDKRYEPTGLSAVFRAPMNVIQEVGN